MKTKMYQVDAFGNGVFTGNPAAVCPLKEWLSDDLMQKIAMENNLAETAFYIPRGQQFHIRWFTPVVEVDLCGHATLAAAHVLFNLEGYSADKVSFDSRSGVLNVSRSGDMLTLDFPADELSETEVLPEMLDALGQKPLAAFRGKTDYMLVFETQEQIEGMNPDFRLLNTIKARGIIVTAKGKTVDFVSRFFAPQSGIDEDPVTGSAHTSLTPYWAKTLGKTEMSAIQLSNRRGYLQCRLNGKRVEISGKAHTYLVGEIEV